MTIALAAIFALLVAADQISKAIAADMLGYVGSTAEFIPGFIRFEYCENTGMAWSLLSGRTLLLTIVSVLMVAVLVYFLVRCYKIMPNLIKVAIVIICAGAVGNLIDRIAFNYVRDFIAFDFMDFPVFNIADSCVTIGIILLAAALIFVKSGREFLKVLDAEDKRKTEERRARRKGTGKASEDGAAPGTHPAERTEEGEEGEKGAEAEKAESDGK